MQFMIDCPVDGSVEVSLEDVDTVVLREQEQAEVVFTCPECGTEVSVFVRIPSFLMAAIEAMAEEPSKQDLWVTPVIGSMVGMYFMHLRGNVRARDIERGYRSTGDKWIWVLTDPLGSGLRLVDSELAGRGGLDDRRGHR